MAWRRTQWFDLSKRELRVLIVAAGLVMLSLVALELVRALTWEEDIRVEGVRETLPRAPVLDLNTAAEHELRLLPGIGEKTARAIVSYRDEHGAFGSLDELRNVPGVGPKTVENLSTHIICIPPKGESD